MTSQLNVDTIVDKAGSGGGAWFHNVQVGSTNGYQIQHFQNGSSADPFAYTGITSHGDLA